LKSPQKYDELAAQRCQPDHFAGDGKHGSMPEIERALRLLRQVNCGTTVSTDLPAPSFSTRERMGAGRPPNLVISHNFRGRFAPIQTVANLWITRIYGNKFANPAEGLAELNPAVEFGKLASAQVHVMRDSRCANIAPKGGLLMSGRPSRVRQYEVEKIVRGAMKAGAKRVDIHVGDARITVRADDDQKPVEADEEISL
jgi:hypothetical protein